MRKQSMKKGGAAFLAAVFAVVLLAFAGCGTPGAQRTETPASAAPAPEATPHIHEWNEGVCSGCGEVCTHVWHDGVCRNCGLVCNHEWNDGVCRICHLHCGHEWNEGVCEICALHCGHSWKDGICEICGLGCNHEWNDGTCTRCGKVCPHTRHDAESGLCETCGSACSHEYLNGICVRCGEAPVFITKLIDFPAEIRTPGEEHGSIEGFYYSPGEGEVLPGEHGTGTYKERAMRNLAVYTPPGYDADRQYNVVIIAPGAGHNARFWLERANMVSGVLGRINGRDLLDRLIERGYIEPMIVVVAEYYLHISPEDVATVYEPDLRERILPFLAENYGTYASVDGDGQLVAAPEHFGFVGVSYGSMVGWQILPESSDLFSYWCLLSGAFQDEEEMIERINTGLNGRRRIRWLYTGDGNQATGWKAYENHITALDKDCWNLELGKNFCFVAIERSEHSFSTWDVGLFNSLQVFFHNSYIPLRIPVLPLEILPN